MAESEIDKIVRRQSETLRRFDDATVRRLLKFYEQARLELRARLDEAVRPDGVSSDTPFTAQQLRGTLAQAEAAVLDLQARFGDVLDEAVIGGRERAVEQLLDLVNRFEPEFLSATPAVQTQLLARVTEPDALLLHQHSVERYGRDLISKIQGHLGAGVAQKASYTQIRDRIVAREASTFAAMRPRAELIVRMELQGAQNALHDEGIQAAAEVLDPPGGREDDPLLKRASEFLDARSHPLSWVLDGETTTPTGEFRVSVSAVQGKAKALGKSGGGVTWRQEGGTYVGPHQPAHFWDRGRVHAYRRSWER